MPCRYTLRVSSLLQVRQVQRGEEESIVFLIKDINKWVVFTICTLSGSQGGREGATNGSSQPRARIEIGICDRPHPHRWPTGKQAPVVVEAEEGRRMVWDVWLVRSNGWEEHWQRGRNSSEQGRRRTDGAWEEEHRWGGRSRDIVGMFARVAMVSLVCSLC